MAIDIDDFLATVEKAVAGEEVPVVDLIAVQTRDPYKVLVATILSARTKDETTAAAAERLFARAPAPADLARLAPEELEKLIFPVGFYRNKAKFLSQLPEALARFDGRVPETMAELLSLPGVGRKTANLVLCVAFAKPAICVDTHVHRIMNIWGYVQTSSPEQTEKALRAKLPRRHWAKVNSLLVAFGQSICRPLGPRCDICPLQDRCPKIGVTPRKKPRSGTVPDGPEVLTFVSWNVNGIRAIEKKGFSAIVKDLAADILAVQETKAQPEQLSEELKNLDGYRAYWHSAERKGYSGVATYTRIPPQAVIEGVGEERFDREGRVLTLEFDSFYFVNIYFPNSGEGLKRLDYKLAFNRSLHGFLNDLGRRKSVVVCGDFNVAHREIDLKNPAANVKNAGFTPDERAWMDEFTADGYLDTFRLFNSEGGHYTWWSYRFNARARNIGWRIDYFCVDRQSRKKVRDARILSEVPGSDHCPVVLEYLASP